MRQRATTDRPPRLNLPPGVSTSDWAREMGRWQNPRIRAFLGCLRIIRDVLESNYAILHCSPTRLTEILRTVTRVADMLRGDITLLLDGPSLIPELEASRQAVRANLSHIEHSLLGDLDRLRERPPGEDLDELRRYLCVAVGHLYRFLQDSFGSMVAADPRSSRDADYFLSRQFPRDVEEAEWLYDTVSDLEDELRGIEIERRRVLDPTVARMQSAGTIPTSDEWQAANGYLERLQSGLAPRLRDVIALRGIRLEELELLAHYANEIPALCRIAIECFETARCAVDLLDSGAEGPRTQLDRLEPVLGGRISRQLRALDEALRDLGIFVPIWRRGISQRRALMLHNSRPRSSPPS